MLVIRPVVTNDQDAIVALAKQSGSGLTTLPKDNERIAEKIRLSEISFSKEVQHPGDEYYLFVLEDTESKEIIGTSALAAAVGLKQPFYTYKVTKTVHASPKLGIHKSIDTLVLGHDYTGTTEICTLFLSPNHRGGGAGRLLSKARFLFVNQHKERFANTIIAEMRGYSDEKGHSPFWESLGRHFFSMDFVDADQRSGVGTNEFIAELMPKYPIYIPMLSKSAQSVIGQVHPDTQPALSMLKEEGFEYKNYVDIFDAGPTIEVELENVETIKNCKNLDVAEVGIVEGKNQYLIASTELQSFRCVIGRVQLNSHGMTIEPKTANALNASPGQQLIISKISR